MEEQAAGAGRLGLEGLEQRAPGADGVDGERELPFPGEGELGQEGLELDPESGLVGGPVEVWSVC